MASHILSPAEIHSYVATLNQYKIEDIGTLTWYEQHQRLQKLNLQAIVEVNGLFEENVKDNIIAEDKISFLVKEAIGIFIWKTFIFDRLFTIVTEPENTFMTYILLLHEGVCIGLLENLLFHADACEALGDYSIDLADYAMGYINTMLLPYMADVDPNDLKDDDNVHERILELEKQRDTIQNDINMRCITILSYMAQNLEILPTSLVHRLLIYHDTPVIFTYLIREYPWKQENNAPIPKVQAHCWLGLRQLLINQEKTQSYYQLTDHRKQTILKVLGYLTDVIIDQIPPLGDLKMMLTQLQITEPGSNISKRPLILEIGPEIAEKLSKIYIYNQDNYTKLFADRLFKASDEEMKILAKGLVETYDFDTIDKIVNSNRKCASGCGEKAKSRCSRCKEVWYCSRNCQIKDWENHKDICEKMFKGRAKFNQI